MSSGELSNIEHSIRNDIEKKKTAVVKESNEEFISAPCVWTNKINTKVKYQV